MARPSRFSPEVRERAVRVVFEHAPEYASQWAAITSIAEKIGCVAETLRSWVRQAERDGGRRPGLTTDECARAQQLERENVELRRANEILRLASAYFAKAELDRVLSRLTWSETTASRAHRESHRSLDGGATWTRSLGDRLCTPSRKTVSVRSRSRELLALRARRVMAAAALPPNEAIELTALRAVAHSQPQAWSTAHTRRLLMSQSSSSVGSFGLSDLAEIKFPESGAGLTIPQSVPGRADQVIE